MKIENKAPDSAEIVLTTKNHFVYVTRSMDSKVHVQVVGRKNGSHQHLILGELLAPQAMPRDPGDSDPNHG